MKRQKNKYLEDIGLKHFSQCQGMELSEGKKKARKLKKKLKRQRKKYGFDSNECCALNFSAAGWLYSRLKRFRKDTAKTGSLDRYTFIIPVLHETDRVSYTETWKTWYTQDMEPHTQRECVDLCISYLKDYLLCESDETAGLAWELEIEQKGAEKAECAFAIFGKILPTMWWEP